MDRKEERTFLSLFLHARPPTPTHRCQTALAKKLVCKHTPTSGKLPSSTPSPRSPFRGWELALRRFPGVAGVGGGRKVGMGTRRGAHACQEPARSQVFSSCNGGRVSTLRTPQAPREGREVPKTAGLRTPRALPNSGTLPSPLPLRSPGEAGAPPSGWVGAESPSARVWVRAGGGGLGRRSPPRRNPAYFRPTRTRAPRPNLGTRARAPRPPMARPGPTHRGSQGRRRPQRAAAAARARGRRGIPGRFPAPPSPRARDRLRALLTFTLLCSHHHQSPELFPKLKLCTIK